MEAAKSDTTPKRSHLQIRSSSLLLVQTHYVMSAFKVLINCWVNYRREMVVVALLGASCSPVSRSTTSNSVAPAGFVMKSKVL